MTNIILVTGPSRSGKSVWAESLFNHNSALSYIATTIYDKSDEGMVQRIFEHQNRRPKCWETIESKGLLSKDINEIDKNRPILIDSLGGFVSANLNLSEREWNKLAQDLICIIQQRIPTIVIVIEQVGWGVVPHTILGNIFQDRIGLLSLKLESISDKSWLLIQGRALDLKSISQHIPIY